VRRFAPSARRCSTRGCTYRYSTMADVLIVSLMEGVFGNSAGSSQHVDTNDLVGSLFGPLGTAPLMFVLPEDEVYVRAQRGDEYATGRGTSWRVCTTTRPGHCQQVRRPDRQSCSKTVRNVHSE
jgi:hypothetical protein